MPVKSFTRHSPQAFVVRLIERYFDFLSADRDERDRYDRKVEVGVHAEKRRRAGDEEEADKQDYCAGEKEHGHNIGQGADCEYHLRPCNLQKWALTPSARAQAVLEGAPTSCSFPLIAALNSAGVWSKLKDYAASIMTGYMRVAIKAGGVTAYGQGLTMHTTRSGGFTVFPTALTAAAQSGHVKVSSLLLANGAKSHTAYELALHMAACFGHVDMNIQLLNADLSVDSLQEKVYPHGPSSRLDQACRKARIPVASIMVCKVCPNVLPQGDHLRENDGRRVVEREMSFGFRLEEVKHARFKVNGNGST
ncbi:hypothetical protein HDU88_002532 [Geranomyces variabilis]|nr:hypothetical protein HDU88_002532 [Geranomyces variabilis]